MAENSWHRLDRLVSYHSGRGPAATLDPYAEALGGIDTMWRNYVTAEMEPGQDFWPVTRADPVAFDPVTRPDPTRSGRW